MNLQITEMNNFTSLNDVSPRWVTNHVQSARRITKMAAESSRIADESSIRLTHYPVAAESTRIADESSIWLTHPWVTEESTRIADESSIWLTNRWWGWWITEIADYLFVEIQDDSSIGTRKEKYILIFYWKIATVARWWVRHLRGPHNSKML